MAIIISVPSAKSCFIMHLVGLTSSGGLVTAECAAVVRVIFKDNQDENHFLPSSQSILLLCGDECECSMKTKIITF